MQNNMFSRKHPAWGSILHRRGQMRNPILMQARLGKAAAQPRCRGPHLVELLWRLVLLPDQVLLYGAKIPRVFDHLIVVRHKGLFHLQE